MLKRQATKSILNQQNRLANNEKIESQLIEDAKGVDESCINIFTHDS